MTMVWRFAIEPGHFKLLVPEGAEPLCVQLKDGEPNLWLRVDTDRPRVPLRFHAAPTGDDVAPKWPYVGTFQIPGSPLGTLVFHLFHEPR